MSTFATLLVVPSIFAVVVGNRVARSPSVYPDDPESSYYDPNVVTGQGHAGQDAAPTAGPHASAAPHGGGDGHDAGAIHGPDVPPSNGGA